jgi:hypothetical protein
MRRKPLIGLCLVYIISIFVNIYWFRQLVRRKRIITLIGNLCLVGGLILVIFTDKIIANFISLWMNYVAYSDLFQIARNALYIVSWKLACRYFPFGSGLGTFGGWISKINYSPIYLEYGLNFVYGLSNVEDANFICDTFWPYILGQFGMAGCICYIYIILKFFKLTWHGIKNLHSPLGKAFSFGVFLMLILSLVESSANPVFLRNPYIYFIFGSLGMLHSLIKSNSKSI